MLGQLIFSFIATLSFSMLFNTPKSELVFCGICGTFAWLAYELSVWNGLSTVSGAFVASLLVTYMCRTLSFVRKIPLTIFLLSGIIPLVPGAGIYSTMYNIVLNDVTRATVKGVETLKISGVIAIGIIIVLSMPRGAFLRKA